MNPLVRVALERSRTILSILTAILVAGALSYIAVPKEGDPDAQIPFVIVNVIHIGISPEDGERLIGRPLESELSGLDGVREMKIVAAEGYVSAVLEFLAGADIDQALIDVREKVDRAKVEFPSETEEPQVQEFNSALQPVIRVNIHGSAPERTLFRLARQLKDRIEGLPQVLEAQMYGHRDEMLEIIIDQARLQAYEIGITDLLRAISTNNALVAAGMLDTGRGRFSVKLPGLIETHRDVAHIPVKHDGDAVVTLGDVASVRRTFVDQRQIAHLNGKPAIGIGVTKRLGENIIETVNATKAIVGAETADWPSSVKITYTDNRSLEIYEILNDLQANVTIAVMLVMAIVVLALGFRSAALVGIAIPASFLFAFLFINVTGNTVNMMVLFALIVAVGMLVDGAIVVIEYADRKIAQGFDRSVAYGAAATRMFWPILSSTATTLSAFLPLLFWPGVTGDYMFFLPVTLILTLSGSLLAAIWFLPALGSVLGQSGGTNMDVAKALDPQVDAQAGAVAGRQLGAESYAKFLRTALRYPFVIIGVTLAGLYVIVQLYLANNHGLILISESEPTGMHVAVSARGNLSVHESRRLVGEIEAIMLNTDGVRAVFSSAGTQDGTDPFSNLPRDAIGEMFVDFDYWRGRRPTDDIVRDVREAAALVSGVRIEVNPYERSLGGGKDVHLDLFSQNRNVLPETARRVRQHLEQHVPGLIDIDDTGQLPGIEWEVRVDREQAKRFGADVSRVGHVVQLITNGIKVGEYRPDDADDELDIRMRLPVAERGLNGLDRLFVQSDRGMVPISNFVVRAARQQVSTLERIDKAWVIAVRANTQPGVLADDKVREIKAWLGEGANIGPAVSYRFGGDDRLQDESAGFLGYAFLGALFLMGAILLTQFNNYYFVLITLSAVVMSTVGVLLGMMLTAQPFSMILTGTGVIALAGIVVNNNIVLIDTYQRLLAAGQDRFDAIIDTARQRFRPILLTTVTTAVGLMPMVLQFSFDIRAGEVTYGSPTSYFWKPLSTAIVFGLGFSTILTLIITPAALAVPIRLNELWHRWKPSLGALARLS